jgi:hypothetical protein
MIFYKKYVKYASPVIRTHSLMHHASTLYHYTKKSLVITDWIMFIYTNFSKSYIKLMYTKTISNKNIVNCKILDLIEHYNFDVDFFPSKVV